MLIPCHTFTSLSRDEKFEPNLNIASQARGLNFTSTVNALKCVFFLNTGAAIYELSRTISYFKFRNFISATSPPSPTIRAQHLSPDSSELNGMTRG